MGSDGATKSGGGAASPAECHTRVRGFVPIAPVDTQIYTQAQFHRCEVRTGPVLFVKCIV